MARDASKQGEQDDLNEDIQFLLSNIRARENGLVFFLERFNGAETSQLEPQEYKIYKREFLQKQKIYSSQVHHLVEKYIVTSHPPALAILKTFWIRLKTIFKVSLQRLKALNVLDDTLHTRYKQIITAIDRNYNDSRGIREYVEIQYFIKKRTIEALIAGKNHFASGLMLGMIMKNRSETLLNHDRKPDQNMSPLNLRMDFCEAPETSGQSRSIYHKLRPLTRTKAKKITSEKLGKNKIGQKQYKRFQSSLQKYERNIDDIMECKLDCALDKKKSIYENVYQLYDSLFDRNIANHKLISKYTFNCGKASKIIIQQARGKRVGHKKHAALELPRNSSTIVKKHIKHENSETLPIQKVISSDKKKLIRPKTSKNTKFRQKHILRDLKIA